jgi:hypothetical protein
MNRTLLALILLFPLGCSKSASKGSDSEFDKQWSSLEQSTEPAFIEGESHGGGLLGEVRRAVDGTNGVGALPKDPLPGPLPDPEVVKVIRANLGAVKGCYAVEERAGTVASGKAIVTLEIAQSGSVANVKVDAPAFSDSQLPQCVSTRAKGWQFPKFSQGPKKFSYPFVFVGG